MKPDNLNNARKRKNWFCFSFQWRAESHQMDISIWVSSLGSFLGKLNLDSKNPTPKQKRLLTAQQSCMFFQHHFFYVFQTPDIYAFCALCLCQSAYKVDKICIFKIKEVLLLVHFYSVSAFSGTVLSASSVCKLAVECRSEHLTVVTYLANKN